MKFPQSSEKPQIMASASEAVSDTYLHDNPHFVANIGVNERQRQHLIAVTHVFILLVEK